MAQRGGRTGGPPPLPRSGGSAHRRPRCAGQERGSGSRGRVAAELTLVPGPWALCAVLREPPWWWRGCTALCAPFLHRGVQMLHLCLRSEHRD